MRFRVSKEYEREAYWSVRTGVTLSLLDRFEESCTTLENVLVQAEERSHEGFAEVALYHLGQITFKWAKNLETLAAIERNSKSDVEAKLNEAVSYFLLVAV